MYQSILDFRTKVEQGGDTVVIGDTLKTFPSNIRKIINKDFVLTVDGSVLSLKGEEFPLQNAIEVVDSIPLINSENTGVFTPYTILLQYQGKSSAQQFDYTLISSEDEIMSVIQLDVKENSFALLQNDNFGCYISIYEGEFSRSVFDHEVNVSEISSWTSNGENVLIIGFLTGKTMSFRYEDNIFKMINVENISKHPIIKILINKEIIYLLDANGTVYSNGKKLYSKAIDIALDEGKLWVIKERNVVIHEVKKLPYTNIISVYNGLVLQWEEPENPKSDTDSDVEVEISEELEDTSVEE